jgi:ubiquitin fusion degradation protein 1
LAELTNSKPRIITPSLLSDDPTRSVPAVLSLPPGKFFFGYKYVPFDPSKAPKSKPTAEEIEAAAEGSKSSFSGGGVTLKGKRKAAEEPAGKPEVKEEKAAEDPWAKFGSSSGNTLKKAATTVKAESKPKSQQPQRDIIDATMEDEEVWDGGIVESDDEDSYIVIDSD